MHALPKGHCINESLNHDFCENYTGITKQEFVTLIITDVCKYSTVLWSTQTHCSLVPGVVVELSLLIHFLQLLLQMFLYTLGKTLQVATEYGLRRNEVRMWFISSFFLSIGTTLNLIFFKSQVIGGKRGWLVFGQVFMCMEAWRKKVVLRKRGRSHLRVVFHQGSTVICDFFEF